MNLLSTPVSIKYATICYTWKMNVLKDLYIFNIKVKRILSEHPETEHHHIIKGFQSINQQINHSFILSINHLFPQSINLLIINQSMNELINNSFIPLFSQSNVIKIFIISINVSTFKLKKSINQWSINQLGNQISRYNILCINYQGIINYQLKTIQH